MPRWPRRRALEITAFVVLGLGGVAVGVAIGATGIGGVLLVPLLIYGFHVPVQSAVAAALWSYLWSGLVAVGLYARHGSIPWRPALWLCLAALPGAYLGARALALLPGRAIEVLIAAILILAGLDVLRRPHLAAAIGRPLHPTMLTALGAATGFAAALTGAGGAVLLVPLLVALKQPVLLAIGLGQAIQLPIAAVATLANLLHGQVDLLVGSVLAATLTLGIALGAPLAHRLPQRVLGRLLALTMIAAGGGIVAQLALSAA